MHESVLYAPSFIAELAHNLINTYNRSEAVMLFSLEASAWGLQRNIHQNYLLLRSVLHLFHAPLYIQAIRMHSVERPAG